MPKGQTRDFVMQLYRRRGVRPGSIYPPKALWVACPKSGMSPVGFKEATDGLIEKGIINFYEKGILGYPSHGLAKCR